VLVERSLVFCCTLFLLCGKSQICVSTSLLCDGHDNCGDNSDEQPQNCPSCLAGQFQCPQVRRCIPRSQVCDGVRQCEYGADELPPHCKYRRNFLLGLKIWRLIGRGYNCDSTTIRLRRIARTFELS